MITLFNYPALVKLNILIVLVFCFRLQSFSQSVIISLPSDVELCDTKTFQAVIQGPTQSNFRIRIEVRMRFPSISGDFEKMECTDQSTTQTPPGSGKQIVRLMTNNVNMTAVSGTSDHIFEWDITNPNPAQNFSFSYDMTIDCNALSEITGNTTFDVVQNWILDPLVSPYPFTINNTLLELETNVNYPLFEDVRLVSSPGGDTYYANYLGANAPNNFKLLYFEYANTGSSNANVIVTFEDLKLCLTSYSIVEYHYTIISKTTVVNDISAQNMNWTLYIEGSDIPLNITNSQKIVFREKVNVNGCECNGGQAEFKWKCDLGNIFHNNECQSCQKSFISSFAIERADTYSVSYSILTPSLSQRQYNHACANTHTEWDIVLENTGQNAVSDINFTLSYNGNVDETTMELIDLSSVTFTFDNPGGGAFASPVDPANPISLPIIGTPTIGNCSNCVSFPTTAPLCSADIPNPINSLAFIIKDLLVGQRCTVHFEMYRCIEEADQILLNEEKRFNLWTAKATGRDECLNGFAIPGEAWLGYDAYKTDEMDLKLFMFPTVFNLTAWPPVDINNPNCPQNPPYSSNSPYANNTVHLNGLFVPGDQYNYGILGSTNNSSNPLSGILRVKINTQKGLLVDDLNFPSALISDGKTWVPINTSVINNENGCNDTEYFYYYDLANPPAGTSAKDLLNTGKLDFRLIPCCTADQTSTYEVLFHLLIDPYDPINPINPTCQQSIGVPGNYFITPQNYTTVNSNFSWLPLSNVNNLINVQCPGCRAPGVIVDNYKMIRSDNSFGLPDETNDRLADTSIPIDVTTYSKKDYLNRSASMHGDYIEDRLEAHFQNGSIQGPLNSLGIPCDNSIVGYEYFQMGINSLDVLELKRSFSQNALVQMGLEVQSITVYIDKPCGSCAPVECLDCDLFDLNSISYHTQVQYDYTAGAGIDPFNINQNTLTLTFNATDFITATNGASLIQTTDQNYFFNINQFEPNQRYRIIVRYGVCGNFMSIGDPDHGVLQTTIDNVLYLTGTPWASVPPMMPNNESQLNALGWTSDVTNTQHTHISDAAFPDSFGFYCETGSGGHNFISNEYFSNLSQSASVVFTENTCDRYISFWSASTIGGGSTFDYFPFEVRRPRLLPDQWTFDATNLSITNIESTATNYFGDQAASLTPVNVSVNTPFNCTLFPTCTLDVSDISITSPAIGCLMTPTPSGLVIGDQTFKLNHKIYLDVGGPNNCDLSGNLVVNGLFDVNTSDYCSAGAMSISSCSSSLNLPAITKTQPLTQDLNPNLDLAITIPQQTAITSTICWSFTLTNVDDGSGTITPAYNIFFDLSAHTSFLTNIVVTINGTSINLNSTNQGIIANSLGVGNQITGTICAQYSSCMAHDPALGFIPVTLNWGWDCDGLPAPTNPLNTIICLNKVENLSIINSSTSFLLTPGATTPYTLCQPFTLNPILESNGLGHLQPIDFELLNMPPGLNIVGTPICTITVSGTSNVITLIPLGSNQWAFPSGTELAFGDTLSLQITFDPVCEYAGFLPQIDFNVVNYCGSQLSISANYPGILQMTGNSCTNCYNITKQANPPIVTVGTVIDFIIEICNNNPAGAPPVSFLLTDLIPPNFTVTSSNIPVGYSIFPVSPPCIKYIISGTFNTQGNYTNQVNIDFDPASPQQTAFAPVTVISNCASIPNIIVTDPYPNNKSSLHSFPNGSLVYITDDFIIDQTETYSNCTFYVDPGKEIVVKPGNILVIEESRIYACTNMWKGIRVEADGTLKSADSEICDAENAVYAEDFSTVILQNSKFFRNYTGFYIPNASTGLNSITTYISNCEFATLGTLRPTYPDQQTTPGMKSLTGIYAHDAFLDLGSIYSPNQFYDMSNGVITFNTTISVTNCIFRDILADPQYQSITGSMAANTSYNGSGVYALGRHGNLLKQRGFGVNGLPSFDNCRFGLFTDRMNVDSRNNNMTGMLTGYRTSFGSNLTMDITGNKIESRSTAIDLRFNDNADHLWVSDNEIHFGEFVLGTFRGISAIQSFEQNGANHDSRIHNNTIFYNAGANNAANGINLNSTSDYFVTENNLFMDDNLVNMNGIIVSGSNNTEISCNVVDGTHNFNALLHQSAITHVLGIDPVISCNIVDGTMNGIRMVGDAGFAVTIQGNEFNNHNRGLFYNQGVTNGQDRRGNLWPTSPMNLTWGAFSDNSQIGGISPYGYDDINPIAPAGKTYKPTTSTTNLFGYDPDTWFEFEDDFIDNLTFHCLVNNDHYCDQFPPCPGCPIDIEIHERIARDSIENAPYTAETLWRLKRELYRKLLSDSTLLSNTLFEDFYNEMEASVTAQLEQLTSEQYEIMQLDHSVINNLNQNRNTLDVQMALLAEQMELYRQALDAGADPSAYLLNIQTIRQNIEDVMTYNRNVFNIADSSLILTADNIRLVNESIYTSETIEENEQVVNEIYLSVLGQEQLQFSQDAVDQLEIIAYQCPLAGGNAVFRARAILSIFNDELVYDDVNICLQAGIILRQIPKKPTAHLYPNPANSSVTLVYELPENTEAAFQLFNSMGQHQLSFALIQDNTTMTFSTELLKPGIYHYRIASNPENQINGKLVIIH